MCRKVGRRVFEQPLHERRLGGAKVAPNTLTPRDLKLAEQRDETLRVLSTRQRHANRQHGRESVAIDSGGRLPNRFDTLGDSILS